MKTALGLLTLTAAVLALSCKEPPGAVPAAPEATYLNLDAGVAYVGIDACKPCHALQYDTYVESQMGRSFKPASLHNSAADFDQAAPVYDRANDLYYQPFRQGDALFIREYRLAGRDTVFQRVEQIDYIVGSGQHTNSHIREENGYLYQMPLTWYAQQGRWDLPPKFDEGNNYRFSRPIPIECMTCHNAMPGFVPGSQNRYTHVPAGIDCERCHGPGALHVREKQAGRIVDVSRAIDYTIVNPGKLPLDRQFDVCRRCHMQGAAVYRTGRTALDFRPGMRLADVENVFWPRHADSVQQFIMASHPDRLQMSACFRQSHADGYAGQPMTCITCHDPHVPIERQGPDHYNEQCQTCHRSAADPASNPTCRAEEAARARQGDNCLACHMPVSGSTDIPHVRITDHFIRTPPPATAAEPATAAGAASAAFVGLASLIEDAPTARDVADGYLTYFEEFSNRPGFLDSAAVYLGRAEQATPRAGLATSLIRLWFLQGDFGAITRFTGTLGEARPSDAWTLYRIGEAFSKTGDVPTAIRYFDAAVRQAPEDLQFLNKRADAYTEDRQVQAALAMYDALLAANPTYGAAYNNRGFARLLLGDLHGAEADFLSALALDPDAVMPLANLASLYYNTNRPAEARPYAKRLMEREPSNERYRQLWDLLQRF